MTIRVLIVDDHAVVRAGIQMMLESDPTFKIVGQGETGHEAIRLTKQHKPDIILMDITMPQMDGIEATQEIRKLPNPPPVLALTIHEGKDYFFHMIRAGASGYVPKRAAPQDLLQAVRVVAAGNVYLDPAIAKELVSDYLRQVQQGSELNSYGVLTDREREVLTLIAEDATNQAIANELEISVNTVERHRENIMRKLNLHTRTELVKYAIRKGLISLDD
ncbi:MAG: DNA-binding response regulator [Anaerolineaceae bacterium]|nr:DNA-binding response regulator [Anaerolineaceae bacterium]